MLSVPRRLSHTVGALEHGCLLRMRSAQIAGMRLDPTRQRSRRRPWKYPRLRCGTPRTTSLKAYQLLQRSVVMADHQYEISVWQVNPLRRSRIEWGIYTPKPRTDAMTIKSTICSERQRGTRVLVALVGSFIALAAAATPGDTSRCHSIQNADQRHLCLALGKRDSSRCHSIQNADSRHACLAQTQGQRSRCHSIRDRDQREMCLALVSRN